MMIAWMSSRVRPGSPFLPPPPPLAPASGVVSTVVVVVAEVDPPQRGGQRQSEDRGGYDLDGYRVLGSADRHRRHRLAKGNDDQRAVPLREVRGADLEPSRHRHDQR